MELVEQISKQPEKCDADQQCSCKNCQKQGSLSLSPQNSQAHYYIQQFRYGYLRKKVKKQSKHKPITKSSKSNKKKNKKCKNQSIKRHRKYSNIKKTEGLNQTVLNNFIKKCVEAHRSIQIKAPRGIKNTQKVYLVYLLICMEKNNMKRIDSQGKFRNQLEKKIKKYQPEQKQRYVNMLQNFLQAWSVTEKTLPKHQQTQWMEKCCQILFKSDPGKQGKIRGQDNFRNAMLKLVQLRKQRGLPE